jgi:oligopeptide transport system substrate-binding protein
MKKKTTRILAMLLAALMVLSACGGNNDGNTTPGDDSPSNSDTTGGNTQTGTPPAPSNGGDPIDELVVWEVSSNEMETFLMAHSESSRDLDVLANNYSALLEIDNYGHLNPAVAKEWGTEDEGKTWTFKLRDDVTWVDVNGNEMDKTTARDWQTAMEWILNYHKNDSKNVSMLRNLIEGAEEYYELTQGMDPAAAQALTYESPEFANVGIEVPDDYTIIYHCKVNCPYFATLATSAALYPIPAGLAAQKSVEDLIAIDNTTMWYNGPYRMTEYVMNNSKTQTRNESYWDKDCSLFDSVRVVMIEDGNMDDMYWETGEVDQTQLASATSQTILDNPSDPRNELVVSTRLRKYSYQHMFNYAKNKADGTPDTDWNNAIANEAFRKSLYWGLNYYTTWYRGNRLDPMVLENLAYTMKNFVYFSDGTDYTDRVLSYLSEPIPAAGKDETTPRRFDAEKALAYKEQAMKELEGKVNFPVNVDYYVKAGSSLDGALVYKENWEETLGTDYIVFNICEYVNSNTQEVYDPQLQSFTDNGWGADYGDVENFHDQILYGVDGAFYSERYSNINQIDESVNPEVVALWKEYTDMVLEAKQVYDLDERYDAFAKAEAFLLDHALVIPYNYSNYLQMTKINDYTKKYAFYGCQNGMYKNWETSTEAYTAEDYARFIEEYEAGK